MIKIDYTKAMIDFIKLKLDTIDNNSAIARMVNKEFDLNLEDIQPIRNKISRLRRKKTNKKIYTPKRLFFDIETSYVKADVWRAGKQWVNADNINGETKIICICYKWQGEEEVHVLSWDKNQDDKQLLKEFIKILGRADEIIAHNGDRFDMKQLRTRCIMQGVLMFPKYRTLDTLKKSRQYFSFQSNRLDYLGKVLEVGRKLDHEGFGLWKRVQEGATKEIREEALEEMINYCIQDVILLEDVFHVLSPYIDHNTNFAVIKEGITGKWKCPNCTSDNVQLSHTDCTPMGWVRRHMKCNDCKKFYHISNKTYSSYLTKDFYSVS